MKKNILLIATFVIFTIQNQAQTVTDIDGNVYTSVQIGTQVWLGQNLKVAHYNNGDSVPNVTDNLTWQNLTSGAYSDYDNIPANSAIYSKLYNHYTITDPRNLCPTGWHVSSEDEWITLIAYLGGDNIAGGKLNETGTTHWIYMDAGTTNESGFTALPGGERSYEGLFSKLGESGIWWNSTAYPGIPSYSMEWEIGAISSDIGEEGSINTYGYAVRCVNNSTGIEKGIYQNEIKIYPNPAINKVNIKYTEKQKVKMQVYNMVGECVLQIELNNVTNEVNISSLSKGIYIIKLTSNNWTTQRKLTKE